jgi:multidrug efflux pump subunit AcrA (membrane-fusion protein)
MRQLRPPGLDHRAGGRGRLPGLGVAAPLDKGVPMQGVVVKEGNRKTIQYPQIGIVQDILVKDGDVVKAGQCWCA